MNVLEDPTGLAQLQKLGLRTVPVLSRGDKYVLGQNTQQIIDFLGLKEDGGPQLSTDELAQRIDKFLTAALELMARERMAVVAGVPTQLALMLRDPEFDSFDLSSLQYIIAGGGPITPGLAEEARARFGAKLATRYSCTEAGIGLGTAFALAGELRAASDELVVLHQRFAPLFGRKAVVG